MTREYTGPPNEWLREVIDELKLHLTELNYRESSILRLDATWKELIVYCEAHQVSEFTVDLEREFVWERYGGDLGDRDVSQNVSRAIHMFDEKSLFKFNFCRFYSSIFIYRFQLLIIKRQLKSRAM